MGNGLPAILSRQPLPSQLRNQEQTLATSTSTPDVSRITTSRTSESPTLHPDQILQDALDNLEGPPTAELVTASGSSPSTSLRGTPNDDFFFIDTESTRDPHFQVLEKELQAPLDFQNGAASVADEDLSDTEEVYRPPPKIAERPATSMASRPSPRSYAVVLDDTVYNAPILSSVIAPPDSAELMLLRDLTQTSASRKTSHLSRMAQKKKNKREARERKKLRKRGQLTTKLFEEMELASSSDNIDCKRLDVGTDSDLLIDPPSRKAKAIDHSHRSTADAALQDYISNIQASDSLSDLEGGSSFLRSTAFEHLNTNDLSDIAAIRAEMTSSEEDDTVLNGQAISMVDVNRLSHDGGSSESEVSGLSETEVNHDSSLLSRSDTGIPGDNSTLGQVSAHEDSSSSVDSDEDEDDDGRMEEAMMGYEESLMDGIMFSYKPHTRYQSAKATHFDFDAFDESLQKQWQSDRAKKALKRQERYLKRLEAQPTKLNRKKAKRAGAPTASMFSLNNAGLGESAEPDFHRLNDRIKTFVEAGSLAQLALPPMDKKFRYAVHMLADTYRYAFQSNANVRYKGL